MHQILLVWYHVEELREIVIQIDYENLLLFIFVIFIFVNVSLMLTTEHYL